MKKNGRISLVFLAAIVLLSSFTLLHDFYISITSVDYNQESNKLEITCQFTTHDMEKAILSLHNIDLNFGEPNEHEKADSLLFDYMVSHFKINTTSTLDFSFVGKEVNLDEMLWVYIESSELEKPKLLEVENTFLIDDFEAQSNITHVNFGKKKHTFSFNRISKTHTYKVK